MPQNKCLLNVWNIRSYVFCFQILGNIFIFTFTTMRVQVIEILFDAIEKVPQGNYERKIMVKNSKTYPLYLLHNDFTRIIQQKEFKLNDLKPDKLPTSSSKSKLIYVAKQWEDIQVEATNLSSPEQNLSSNLNLA